MTQNHPNTKPKASEQAYITIFYQAIILTNKQKIKIKQSKTGEASNLAEGSEIINTNRRCIESVSGRKKGIFVQILTVYHISSTEKCTSNLTHRRNIYIYLKVTYQITTNFFHPHTLATPCDIIWNIYRTINMTKYIK